MLEITVEGMTCGHCASHVTKAIKDINPLAKVNIDLNTKQVRIEGDINLDELSAVLAEEGYTVMAAT